MNTSKKIYEADNEGVVHVQLPTGKPGRRVEVTVVWEDSEQEATSASEDLRDLVGLLRDVPLERPPQVTTRSGTSSGEVPARHQHVHRHSR